MEGTVQNHKTLAKLYGVSERTIRFWLKPYKEDIGEMVARCYTPKQVTIIFEKIGKPDLQKAHSR